jgi:hypothetical protein
MASAFDSQLIRTIVLVIAVGLLIWVLARKCNWRSAEGFEAGEFDPLTYTEGFDDDEEYEGFEDEYEDEDYEGFEDDYDEEEEEGFEEDEYEDEEDFEIEDYDDDED